MVHSEGAGLGLVEQKTHQKVTARHWPELLISSLREAAQCPLKRLETDQRAGILDSGERW